MPETGEPSATVAERVARAREIQAARYADVPDARTNADAHGKILDHHASLDEDGKALVAKAAEHFGFSARAYHRIRRVARTIADLAGRERITTAEVAEAIGYRLTNKVG